MVEDELDGTISVIKPLVAPGTWQTYLLFEEIQIFYIVFTEHLWCLLGLDLPALVFFLPGTLKWLGLEKGFLEKTYGLSWVVFFLSTVIVNMKINKIKSKLEIKFSVASSSYGGNLVFNNCCFCNDFCRGSGMVQRNQQPSRSTRMHYNLFGIYSTLRRCP